MGYVRNHTIVVESSCGDYVDRAHVKAKEIFPWVSPISEGGINASRSFFIPPDGSKEWWPASDRGDIRRAEFKKWLKEQAFEDGSSAIHWVELYFGGDDERAAICDSSNKPKKK